MYNRTCFARPKTTCAQHDRTLKNAPMRNCPRNMKATNANILLPNYFNIKKILPLTSIVLMISNFVNKICGFYKNRT